MSAVAVADPSAQSADAVGEALRLAVSHRDGAGLKAAVGRVNARANVMALGWELALVAAGGGLGHG